MSRGKVTTTKSGKWEKRQMETFFICLFVFCGFKVEDFMI